MDVVALYTRLKPGQELAYDEFHRTVPDEIARDLDERGVVEWRIWRRGLDLFHVVVAHDYARFASSPPTNDTAAGWGEVMAVHLAVNNDLESPGQNAMRPVWALTEQLGTEPWQQVR